MAEDQRKELVSKMKRILEQQRGESDAPKAARPEKPAEPVAPAPVQPAKPAEAPKPVASASDAHLTQEPEIVEIRGRLTDGLASGLSSRQCMLLLEELLQKAPAPKEELLYAIQVALGCKDRAVFVKQALANHADKVEDMHGLMKDIARKVQNAGLYDHALQYCEKILEKEPENTEFLWLFCMATMKIRGEAEIESCDTAITELPQYQLFLSKTDKGTRTRIEKQIKAQKDRLVRQEQLQEQARKREELARKQREQDFEEARLQVSAKARAERRRDIVCFLISLLVILGVAALNVFVIAPDAEFVLRAITLVPGLIALVVSLISGLNIWKKPAKRYEMAKRFLAAGNYLGAARAFGSAGNYGDAKQKFQVAWEKRTHRDSICVGKFHTVALKKNGMILTTGKNESGQCSVSSWMDILSVSAGGEHSVGLTVDGTVVTAGSNLQGQCDVANWKNIVSVSAGFVHTVGLREDGTVLATGANKHGQCDTAGWKNIVAVSAGTSHTVGLRIDGTVVATGKNDKGQCNVSQWTDIVAISAGGIHTVGIKADGTVVAAGENYWGQCNVERWRDIMAVFAAGYRTIGLKADGTLVGTGWDAGGTYKVPNWTDVVAIGAGDSHTVGLRSDGTVVAEGSNDLEQCAVEDWEEIRLPG